MERKEIDMNQSIVDYYKQYNEENRLVQAKAQKIEYITTKYILDEIIPPNSSIIELGAGTGRYSFYFASQDHQVTATDVVPKHITEMKNKLRKQENIDNNLEIELLDATDLSRYKDNSFDVVLSLGPLYHLREQDQRQKCISESIRVLKEKGILAAAYINKFFVLTLLAKHQSLNKEYIDDILKHGKVKKEVDDEFLANAYFSSPVEIENIFNSFQTNKLEHVGTDGIAILLQEMVNKMSVKEYENWLKYHFETFKEDSILGYSNHGLYICEKATR